MSTAGRVMIVDDNPSILKLLVLVLRSQFEVITATSFDEAVTLLEKEGDLVGVISDYDLGEGPGGIDLLEEVQRRRPRCARILLSGYTSATIAAGTPRDLISGVLRKPFNYREILPVLRAALAKTQGR